MRKFSCFGLCLAAGLVLLQAQAARASGIQLVDDINVDENGNGTYDVQDISAGTTSAPQPLTVLSGGAGAGLSYELPYTININGNYPNQFLAIKDADGSQSDLVIYQNQPNGSGGTMGVMTVYSNDSDGDLADVSPGVWSGLVSNYNAAAATTTEDSHGVAFYSTNGDPSGVPGDPFPHPTVEANYYVNSAVPEPASVALLGSFVGVGLVGWVWRRRRRA